MFAWMILTLIGLYGVSVSCSEDAPIQEKPMQKECKQAPVITEMLDSEIQRLTMEYTSLAPDMKTPARLVGCIVMSKEVMEKREKAACVVLYHHVTTSNRSALMSENGDALMSARLMIGASKHCVIIAPDLYGWGSTQDQPQAYLLETPTVVATQDCLEAAFHVLDSLGIDIENTKKVNVGYSAGAYSAMAYQKHLSKLGKVIHFDHCIVGGGPFDIAYTYKKYVEDDHTGYPCAIPLMIVSYKESLDWPYAYERFFRAPLRDHVQDWILTKQLSSGSINSRIGSNKVSDIMTEEACDTTSEIGQLCLKVFRENSLCGQGAEEWTPDTKTIYDICGSRKDDVVPCDNNVMMADYLEKKDARVKRRFVDGMDHTKAGVFLWMPWVLEVLKDIEEEKY